MSRCEQCEHDICDAIGTCYKECPMYAADSDVSYCKCVAYDFDYREDCPYFVSKKEEQ